MNRLLPLEIVDLILRLSLDPVDLISTDDGQRSISTSQRQRPSSSSPARPSHRAHAPIDVRQASNLSTLSSRYRAVFQPDLYRYVALTSDRVVSLLARTLASRPDLGHDVRSLAIYCDDTDDPNDGAGADAGMSAEDAAPPQSAADVVLSACPNATHLLLSGTQFADLATRLYNLRRPKEITLVNVSHERHFDGIVTRHRDLTAAALQNDPRVRAVLGRHDAADTGLSGQPSLAPQATPVSTGERSLSHLHLVNFDPRLLHHLVTLSSLTHLVLTNPYVPARRQGAPGLSVIPRSHLMLLLGSGNIARITIRTDLATCIRIMEEIASIAPIDDRKLVFRPIRLESDVLYPDRTQDAQPLSQLGTDAAALHFSISERKLDLLAEYLNRVRLAYRTSPSTSSSGDPDTSRDSSGFTSHGRSSDGSAGGTSHSASTDSGDDDSADIGRRGHDEDDFSDVDDFGESVDESAERPPLAAPSTRTLNTNAPPLNIPIEELLRSEGFTPAGLAGQRAPSSQASSGTEQTSSASPSGTASSNRQRRQRRLLRDTPFTLRRTDLRGATQHNIDLCTELYEALAAEAGVDAEPQAGMAAW